MASYEIIWYPVVWEKEKTADNVIGYSIREEQSVLDYSVLNGASFVSNWEATLIYWVNAPKIISDTSIVERAKRELSWCSIAWNFWYVYLSAYSNETTYATYTISDIVWDYVFETTTYWWYSWVKIPMWWECEITASYIKWFAEPTMDFVFLINWEAVHDHLVNRNAEAYTETFTLDIPSWAIFQMRCRSVNNTQYNLWFTPTISLVLREK